MSIAAAPHAAHITGWDRAVVIALGGAGCALSYDALQQMAIAIHVRGFLTYLFPLVIDGFIAYGVRALLVLRDAPLRARLYVWTLFGVATAASIWANALHAVRLNQQDTPVNGLRLGDTVVAILSTLAPLALAGAVHLYILIARGPAKDTDRRSAERGDRTDSGQSGQPESTSVTRTDRAGQHPVDGQVSAGQPVTAVTDRPRLSPGRPRPGTRTASETSGSEESFSSDTDRRAGHRPRLSEAFDLAGHPDRRAADNGKPANRTPVITAPNGVRDSRSVSDQASDRDTEELLRIARTAVRAEDKLTRKVVAQAIRGQKIPLSNDTLTELMVQLRKQHDQPVTTAEN